MKSKSSTKSVAPKADPVVPKPAAARKPRARKAATAPAVVDVANDAVANVVIVDLTDRIAIRAYELFVEHGFEHGRDVEHWLVAERELLARQ